MEAVEVDLSSRSFSEDDKPDLSMKTKEAIRNIHRNYACNREDDLHLHSLTPASSLNFETTIRSVDSVNMTSINPEEPASSYIVQVRESLTSEVSLSLMGPKISYDISDLRSSYRLDDNPFGDDREVPSPEEFDLSFHEFPTDYLFEPVEDSSAIVELVPEVSIPSFVQWSFRSRRSASLLSDEQNPSKPANRFLKPTSPPPAPSSPRYQHAPQHWSCEAASDYHKEEENLSSSSADEGKASVVNRLFLADTASKNKLSSKPLSQPFTFFKLEQKILTQSNTFMESIHTTSISMVCQIEAPDMSSPILRKLVVCEERKESRSLKKLQIVGSVACAGYNAAIGLEFSNVEGRSRGFITYDRDSKHILTSLCSPKAVEIFLQVQVSWVVCGFEHCALVTSKGEVRTWGYGASGCLGHGDTNSYSFPTAVADLRGSVVVYMECGGYHNAAVTQDGELYVWGRGDVHQLGVPLKRLCKDEMGYVALKPFLVKEFSRTNKKLKGVACGEAHTLVLDSEGTVYAFGWAEDGQLGLPRTELRNSIMTSSIRKVKALAGQRVIKVSAGSIFSACLDDAGQVYVWGNGEQGQLGLGNRVKFTQLPTLLSSLSTEFVVDIVLGESHVLCVTQSGKLYGWGQGLAGNFDNRVQSAFAESFPAGSDLVCYLTRRLAEVDIAHRMVIPGSFVQKKKQPQQGKGQDLFAALQQKLKGLAL
jgi:hypothetical protein